jgi:hypothetical protein
VIRAKLYDIPEELGIFRGNDFPFDVFVVQSDGVTAVDLTGWSVKCEIRKRRNRNAPLVAALTVSIPDPTDGKIYMRLTDTETAELPVGTWHYDILFTDPAGNDFVYMYGEVTVSGTVTAK